MIQNSPSSKIHFNYTVPVFRFTRKTLLKTFLATLFLEENTSVNKFRVIFCTDEYLLSINKQFLQHDYYTDIITFNYANNQEPVNGECYISIDRVKDNALKEKSTFKGELLRVIIHGALHLCGHDDKDDAAFKMRMLEDKYLSKYLALEGSTWNKAQL